MPASLPHNTSLPPWTMFHSHCRILFFSFSDFFPSLFASNGSCTIEEHYFESMEKEIWPGTFRVTLMRARQWSGTAWLACLVGRGVSWHGVMWYDMACRVVSPRVMCRSFPCAAGHYTGTLAGKSRSYAVHVVLCLAGWR